MNPTGDSKFNQARIEWAIRLKYSPMPALDMDILASQLNAFRIGDLRQIGKTWEVMMERDGELAVNSDKRKSDAAGLEWQIVSDGSPDGDRHAAALQYFYDNLSATQALDQDDIGGVDHLIYQVASALDFKYSIHEMLLRVDNAAAREVTAEFRHTPIWFFEARRGYLGYMPHIFDLYGIPCVQGEWLTAVNIGWMRPLSMAYAMKMFPLRDWLLFCTRYGSGFLDATTDAGYETPEWTAAQEALNTMANDGAVLHNSGVSFKFLEQSARNSLPFHPIVEMINGLYAKCYRGVDLATGSRGAASGEGGTAKGGNPIGASIQAEESGIFLLRDARWVTGVFNERIDRPVTRYLFGQEPRAWFVLMPPLADTSTQDLAALQGLVPMGFKVMLKEVYQRFRWSVPEAGEACLAPAATLPTPNDEGRMKNDEGKTEDGEKTPPQNPKSEIQNPKTEKPAAVDATGEETEPLLKGAEKFAPTATAREDETAPIGAGAKQNAAQSPNYGLPIMTGPQVPALGYSLPNSRLEILSARGLAATRAAQALRRSIGNRQSAIGNAVPLANETPEKLRAQLLEKVQAIVLKSFIAGLGGKKALANMASDQPRDSLGEWVDENGGGLSEKDNIQRGQNAMDRAIRQKSDVQKAMYRKGVGQIDFPYGNPGDKSADYAGGHGVSHIVAKHGERDARALPEVLAKGKVSPNPRDPENKLLVTHGDFEAALAKENTRKAYLLTGFRKQVAR